MTETELKDREKLLNKISNTPWRIDGLRGGESSGEGITGIISEPRNKFILEFETMFTIPQTHDVKFIISAPEWEFEAIQEIRNLREQLEQNRKFNRMHMEENERLRSEIEKMKEESV